MPSDVQVFVRFKDQCVFAGEELHCVITFKNVAEHQEPPTPGDIPPRFTKRNSISQIVAAQATSGINNILSGPHRAQNARSPSAGRDPRSQIRHQNSYSVSNPPTPIHRDDSPSDDSHAPIKKPAKHQRSVSIISMNSPVLTTSPKDGGRAVSKPLTHRRSSTMVIAGKDIVDSL